MDKVELVTFTVGELETNSYLVYSPLTKEAIIIDYPYPSEPIEKFIKDKNLSPVGIILTHGHFDHIGGIKGNTSSLYIHPEDERFLYDATLNFSAFLGINFIIDNKLKLHYLYEGEMMIGSFSIQILHTPGHTPGSVSIMLNHWLFSGDTLFLESVGRTDIPLASYKELIRSIERKLMRLDGDVKVFPGHGPSTTIGYERVNNPFILER